MIEDRWWMMDKELQLSDEWLRLRNYDGWKMTEDWCFNDDSWSMIYFSWIMTEENWLLMNAD